MASYVKLLNEGKVECRKLLLQVFFVRESHFFIIINLKNKLYNKKGNRNFIYANIRHYKMQLHYKCYRVLLLT